MRPLGRAIGRSFFMRTLLLLCSFLPLLVAFQSATPSVFRSSTFRLSYSNTADPPFQGPSPRRDSFEERMRKLVLPTKKEVSRRKPVRKAPPTVHSVSTLAEYKEAVANQDCLVVVRFYASWCKACQALTPAFYQWSAQNKKVKFVQVQVTPENSSLHQGLQVPSLPYLHIYHPTAGLVHEGRVLKKELSMYKRIVQDYQAGSCDLPELQEGGVYTSPYF